jgi:hypothetical protein
VPQTNRATETHQSVGIQTGFTNPDNLPLLNRASNDLRIYWLAGLAFLSVCLCCDCSCVCSYVCVFVFARVLFCSIAS